MSALSRLPAGRPGQLLAVALTLLAVVLVWEVAAAPLIALHGARADTLAETRAREARALALARALPALRAEARRVTLSGPAAASLLDGATDAVAAAALQGRVQDLAASTGSSLSSTEALPARQDGRYRRIALRVSVTATLPVLVHLLRAIETGSPRMLVDDLQLHTSPVMLTDAHAASPALDTSLTVIAFRAGQGEDRDDQDAGQPGSSGDTP